MDGNVIGGFFSNIVNLLKAISLTQHTCSKLKSFDYDTITIKFVNFFSTKFNGDILFELPFVYHSLGHSNNFKVWIESLIIMLGANCRLVTSKIHLDWAS
jgi:hypothetical protein